MKPTLQITDERYPNIYACGDVTDMPQVPCPNARSAMRQAATVAKNLLRSIDGKKPSREYEHHWADTFIKLTLGLVSNSPFGQVRLKKKKRKEKRH